MSQDAVARLEVELVHVARMSASSVEESRERIRHPAVDPSPLELWPVAVAFDGTLSGQPARDVLALLRPSLTSGALPGSPPLITAAVVTLIWNEELEAARGLCEGIAAIARPRGWLHTLMHESFLGSMVALRAGAAREAEADARFALEVKLRSEAPPEATLWALAPLLDALVERDALGEAERTLEATGVGRPPRGELASPLMLEVRARLRCAQGRWTEAQRDLQGAAEDWEALRVEHPGVAQWRAGAAAVLAALGDLAGSERLAREHLSLAERVGTPGALGAGLRALARSAPRAEAIALLERAVAILARSPMRLEHTRALCDLGAALRRAGQRREAREPLRQALDLAERGGLVRLARQAREELVAAGARPRRAALSGPGALTAAEHRVAVLAAGGLTNREIAQQLFVTQRTSRRTSATPSRSSTSARATGSPPRSAQSTARRRPRPRACGPLLRGSLPPAELSGSCGSRQSGRRRGGARRRRARANVSRSRSRASRSAPCRPGSRSR